LTIIPLIENNETSGFLNQYYKAVDTKNGTSKEIINDFIN
jgi:hypothetical protein